MLMWEVSIFFMASLKVLKWLLNHLAVADGVIKGASTQSIISPHPETRFVMKKEH